ncbi:MAG: hypothetical protein K6F91_03770, partial [Ruminococcus sp.]|nr:hypothetical protein [Ruminococcus sp.]
ESYNGGRFYMEKGYADNNQDNSQISLIDVEFYDPNDSTKVAYHLYVPVLTKKMISFSFKSASLAGTDFKADTADPDSPDPYEFGNKLAEELGAWFTSYMVFTYPKSELQELIDSGKGLNWNHNKVIDLNYNNTDGTLSGDTKLVLVDISSGDKAYYSKLSDVKTSTEQCDTIDLSAFTDSSGGIFTQCTLNDFTSVTAEQVSSNGNYKITNDESKAVVKAMLNGEEKMFEYDAQNGTYKLTVEDDGYERYFLSFLTPGTGSICNFDIYCPKYLSGTGGAPKGIRNDNDSLKTVVITGNIFTQTTTETVALVGNTSSWVVDSIYNKLKVDVSTTISWADANQFGYLSSHLNDDNINIYHAFVLELSKHMQSSTTNIIGGNPSFTTTYSINGSPFKIGDDDEGEITTNHGGKQYALLETHDIKKYLTQSSSPVTVTSSTIIDYSDGTDRVNAFPTATQNGNIGVNISATSSLSYSGTEEKLVYSTMKDTAYDNKYYYIKETENASLSYNAKLLDDIYDKDGLLSKNKSQLGLNARNLADEARTFIPLETVASYNASVIDISEADSLVCTLSLYKKNDSGEYEKINDLSDYFTDEITLTSTDTSIAQINATVDVPEADSVVFTSGDEALNLTAKTFDADISYSAKIKGDGFNEYANYKVLIEVKLLKADTEPVEGSTATNYIIYTNAKIDPSIVHS